MEVKLLQSEKQYSPKLVTELGIVMEVKLLQSEKQYSPKLVTELGIVMEVKGRKPKQPSPNFVMVYVEPSTVTVSGITMS